MTYSPSHSTSHLIFSRRSPSRAAFPLTGYAPASSYTAGFSMLEVMLAITLAGILLAIVIVRVDVNRMQANSTVQMLSTTMVASQREAITKQHDVILTFDQLNRRVRVIWDLNSSGTADPGDHIRMVNLDTRITFGLGGAPARAFGLQPINFNKTIGGLPALIFHRNGSASGVGGFYITTNRAIAEAAKGSLKYADDTRAIEIVRATGRSEWFRHSGPNWIRGF
jgi:prepilin-type N-terminal cleavage/methylation domain-containing protein